MARAHEVAIAADGRAFNQAIKSDVIKPVEEAARSLDELAEAGDDVGRDGARGIDKLEDALKDAQRAAKKTDDAVDDIGTTGRASFDKVRGGATELQQEMGQNLGETVASFKGDFSDLGQVGQDTLGGLAASLAGAGPGGLVGAAALAAGAVGLGLVTAELQEAAEKQEALEQAAADWAGAYEDAAARVVSASHIVGEVNAISQDPERFKEAGENARNWGIDVQTAMLVMAGDATALEIATASLTDRQREWGEIMEETHTGSASSYDKSTMTAQQREFGDEVRRGTEALGFHNDAMAMGQEQARAAAGALFDYAMQVGTATGETDDLGNAIITLPDGKQIVVDAKTQQAHTNIDALEQAQLTPKTVSVDADTSRARNAINALNGIHVGISVGAQVQRAVME